jgi:hypothetical protein
MILQRGKSTETNKALAKLSNLFDHSSILQCKAREQKRHWRGKSNQQDMQPPSQYQVDNKIRWCTQMVASWSTLMGSKTHQRKNPTH